MKERLQKIIARAGIASRRHAEQLILSGQVRVNGRVVTELGTKADTDSDKVEVAGRAVEAEERRAYLLMNKPPEVMSTLADPEGRKTLKNLLRGFPSRVYPVGNLEYASSGLVFMTNDGDLAAELLKKWEHLEQIYYVKIKGMLTLADLERVGKEAGVKMQTLRQPGAARGHGANYWYEVTMRDSRLEALRRVLFKEKHPIEKLKRVALGPLTVEGIAPGRYRLLQPKEAQTILTMKPAAKKFTPKQEPAEHKPSKRGFQKRSFEKRGR
ncbi:MAG TPA: S4 domain-containing protein [Candidatus Dormibacteraeota bacterium]|jgi:23S rRNA pseudouridine2605 synthase|nr:S4 domain-containing protein [Candidatus Dormibacteraeota bacterium]